MRRDPTGGQTGQLPGGGLQGSVKLEHIRADRAFHVKVTDPISGWRKFTGQC
jgi:hypothetical protein